MHRYWNAAMSATTSVVITCAVVACADPAVASTTAIDAPHVVVSFNHASLASAAGRNALSLRIRQAAARVCRTNEAGQRLAEMLCREEAMARAWRDLDEVTAHQPAAAVRVAAR